MAPPTARLWKRILVTLIPRESAALGCVPTALTFRPHGVLKITYHATGTRRYAKYTNGLWVNSILPSTGIFERRGISKDEIPVIDCVPPM